MLHVLGFLLGFHLTPTRAISSITLSDEVVVIAHKLEMDKLARAGIETTLERTNLGGVGSPARLDRTLFDVHRMMEDEGCGTA